MFIEVVKSKIENIIITDIVRSDNNIILIDGDIVDLIDAIDDELVHLFSKSSGYEKDVIIKKSVRFSGIVCLHVCEDDKCLIKEGDSISIFTHEYIENKLLNQYKMTSIDYKYKNKMD